MLNKLPDFEVDHFKLVQDIEEICKEFKKENILKIK